jgi:hypothetical protein
VDAPLAQPAQNVVGDLRHLVLPGDKYRNTTCRRVPRSPRAGQLNPSG